ncbi:MAG: hypothetical protein ABWY06_01705 [Pseudomonas sp.]|uniref:hypothetical protein n=1 Tax=Pseudomonas sp. TaxID=306 RepID=UPI003390B047
MKVDQQLPLVTAVNPQERRQTQTLPATGRPHKVSAEPNFAAPATAGRTERSASFSLQLNQQLTSMQTADGYLADLAARLGLIKLSLSRQLSGGRVAKDGGELQAALDSARRLLEERAQRSGQALDARLQLHLHEPVRAHFSLEGLESMTRVQQAGAETLLFSAGRKLAEPLAVVLEEGMTEQQVLRRFNSSLGQAGIRIELESGGALKFSAAESLWSDLKAVLAVQGGGNLFAQGGFTRLRSHEDELLRLPASVNPDDQRELRQVLDSAVQSLDRIELLREQIAHRQRDIRDFLQRQADKGEKQWAAEFTGSLYQLLREGGPSYLAVSQMLLAQSNLNRFGVVSLLS